MWRHARATYGKAAAVLHGLPRSDVEHLVLARVSEDEGIVRNLMHLEQDGVGGNKEPFACVRRGVCGRLYTDSTDSVGGTCYDNYSNNYVDRL